MFVYHTYKYYIIHKHGTDVNNFFNIVNSFTQNNDNVFP